MLTARTERHGCRRGGSSQSSFQIEASVIGCHEGLREEEGLHLGVLADTGSLPALRPVKIIRTLRNRQVASALRW
jgi:hypothetical protein